MFVYLLVCLFVHLPVCLSLCLALCLSLCLTLCLSLCASSKITRTIYSVFKFVLEMGHVPFRLHKHIQIELQANVANSTQYPKDNGLQVYLSIVDSRQALIKKKKCSVLLGALCKRQLAVDFLLVSSR